MTLNEIMTNWPEWRQAPKGYVTFDVEDVDLLVGEIQRLRGEREEELVRWALLGAQFYMNEVRIDEFLQDWPIEHANVEAAARRRLAEEKHAR